MKKKNNITWHICQCFCKQNVSLRHYQPKLCRCFIKNLEKSNISIFYTKPQQILQSLTATAHLTAWGNQQDFLLMEEHSKKGCQPLTQTYEPYSKAGRTQVTPFPILCYQWVTLWGHLAKLCTLLCSGKEREVMPRSEAPNPTESSGSSVALLSGGFWRGYLARIMCLQDDKGFRKILHSS